MVKSSVTKVQVHTYLYALVYVLLQNWESARMTIHTKLEFWRSIIKCNAFSYLSNSLDEFFFVTINLGMSF